MGRKKQEQISPEERERIRQKIITEHLKEIVRSVNACLFRMTGEKYRIEKDPMP
ncbi:MAG: hypothetical protein FWC00_00515 [Firmicutes bacterium]|nr:hypothetical protein [Bacillota bacterium]